MDIDRVDKPPPRRPSRSILRGPSRPSVSDGRRRHARIAKPAPPLQARRQSPRGFPPDGVGGRESWPSNAPRRYAYDSFKSMKRPAAPSTMARQDRALIMHPLAIALSDARENTMAVRLVSQLGRTGLS